MSMSRVDIVNLALGHLIEKTIVDINEKSVEAKTAREFYDISLKETLRDFSWPFATVYKNLNLVVGGQLVNNMMVQANQNWAFAYQYPSDCLYFRRILSGLSQDTRQSRVPYIIAKSDFINPQPQSPGTPVVPEFSYTPTQTSGLFIFTNMQYAQCEYTVLPKDESDFTPDFIMALSYRLAFYMAPRLTGGDPFKMKDACLASYDLEITKAKANGLNEQQTPDEVPSEFSRSRNGNFFPADVRPPWYPTESGYLID